LTSRNADSGRHYRKVKRKRKRSKLMLPENKKHLTAITPF